MFAVLMDWRRRWGSERREMDETMDLEFGLPGFAVVVSGGGGGVGAELVGQ